jgi:hypothetical protein
MGKKAVEKEKDAVTWLRLGGFTIREDAVEPLLALFAPAPTPGGLFVDKFTKLFPEFSTEEAREIEKFGKYGGAEILNHNGDYHFRALLPVIDPRLDVVLRFLKRAAKPDQVIFAELVTVWFQGWGTDYKIKGWRVLKDGTLRPLELGFKDPETGEFWALQR